MTEYIYTKQNTNYRTFYSKMILKKETRTQIVAATRNNPDCDIRFDKATGRQRGVSQWGRARYITSAEAYKEGKNEQINESIADNEGEIASIQERIDELKATLIL